jgi:(5-formylfuran-3-yl)methyl phosphate synthase
MTKLLASVRDLDEARIALESGADIIDLKEPAHGALGAVAHDIARAVVAFVGARVPVSATVGDLPWRASVLAPAVAAMAATGVDYVKAGVFSTRDMPGDAEGEARLLAAAHSAKLIAVLFADRAPDFDLVDACAAAGFAGVMLDTADKSRGALLDHWPARLLRTCAQTPTARWARRIAAAGRFGRAVADRAGLSRLSRRAVRGA